MSTSEPSTVRAGDLCQSGHEQNDYEGHNLSRACPEPTLFTQLIRRLVDLQDLSSSQWNDASLHRSPSSYQRFTVHRGLQVPCLATSRHLSGVSLCQASNATCMSKLILKIISGKDIKEDKTGLVGKAPVTFFYGTCRHYAGHFVTCLEVQ